MRRQGILITEQTNECSTHDRGLAHFVEGRNPRNDIVTGMRQFIRKRKIKRFRNCSVKSGIEIRIHDQVAISDIALNLLVAE